MKYVLAIDLGTSGPKVAFVNEKSEIVGDEFEPVPLLLSENGGAEQNPKDWWKAIVKAVRRLTDKKLIPVDNISGICCTAQWSGTVAVDKNGHPLMNALIWMDTRGSPYIQEAVRGAINFDGFGVRKAIDWVRLTGGAPGHGGKDPIAHILYLKHQRPDIYRRTYKFLEPLDYLNLRLTGEFAASFVSMTLHWVTDTRKLNAITYNKNLIKYSTIEADKFPTMKPVTAILGPVKEKVAQAFGIKPGTPVLMGLPDFQSAALGSGAIEDYQGHIYIGTSSWLTCHIPFQKVDISHAIGAIPSAIPDRYIVSNEQECAGVCLNYLADNFFFHDDPLKTEKRPKDLFRIFDNIVKNTPPWPKKLIFTPWLYGERSPVDDFSIRSGFYNLSLQTKRPDLIRAVFEGVALNNRWLMMYVEKFINHQLNPIRIVGGGANSAIWCQIFADILNRNIEQLENPILTNLRGAGVHALIALGLTTLQDISHKIPIRGTYAPNPATRDLYEELFQEFTGIYQQNKEMYRRLNKNC